jgi:hypothetical protein
MYFHLGNNQISFITLEIRLPKIIAVTDPVTNISVREDLALYDQHTKELGL